MASPTKSDEGVMKAACKLRKCRNDALIEKVIRERPNISKYNIGIIETNAEA